MLFSCVMLGALLSRPELTYSQGMVESQMNPFAVGRRGEKGAFQVIEKHWGRVPRHLRDQIKQNERIMDELLRAAEGDLRKALISYNGKGLRARRYASKVLKGAVRVAVIGI